MERIYQQMLAQLRDRGSSKQPTQTPLEYAQIIRDTHAATTSAIVTEISQAYTAWRYGQEAQRLDRLQELLVSLKQVKVS